VTRLFVLRLFVVLLTVASFAAWAQSLTRIRGTITALDGNVLLLKTRGEGKDVRLQLAPDTTVASAKPITLAELKPGAYVGAAALNQGGRLVALEVHTLGPQVPAGHTPWDLEPGSTMTNANLAGVARVSGGNEITLQYKDGEQKIVVPDGTPIATNVPGTRADLKPGEYVFVAARQEPDGLLTALRIQVSKDGFKPPQ
jgi:hypothetical protein